MFLFVFFWGKFICVHCFLANSESFNNNINNCVLTHNQMPAELVSGCSYAFVLCLIGISKLFLVK